MPFPHKPYVVMVSGNTGNNMLAWRGQVKSHLLEYGGTDVNVSWADRSVTWANGDINNNLNYTGFTHQVIALLAADE